jgi:GNAT superfamily N-acetyltransferase
MRPLNIFQVTRVNFDRYAATLAAMYVQCFAEAPWNEVFHPEAVALDFEEALKVTDSILLVAEDAEGVLGATLLYPLQNNDAVTNLVGETKAMYCQELFVSKTHQCRGIGGRLFDTATGIAMGLGYNRRVLRTSANHESANRFYLSRGYRKVGSMECVSAKLKDGIVAQEADYRVVLLQDNSPPNVSDMRI